MAKSYTVQFGSGDPRGYTGLSPTFLLFWNMSTGTTNAPPSITELVVGKTGLYSFSYGVTQPIAFLLDAATTSPGPTGRYVSGQIDPNDRSDEYGNTLIAYGLTTIAQANNIGTTLVAQGSTLVAYGGSLSILAVGSSLVAIGTTTAANFANIGSTLVGVGNTLLSIGFSTPLFTLMGSSSSTPGSDSVDPTTVFGFLKRAQETREGNETYTKNTGILTIYTRSLSLLATKTIADSTATTTKT